MFSNIQRRRNNEFTKEILNCITKKSEFKYYSKSTLNFNTKAFLTNAYGITRTHFKILTNGKFNDIVLMNS
jgi:hypothetical protein